MGIGAGITLLVIGLILVLEIINFPTGVDNVISESGQTTLGWILVAAGALGIILALVMNQQRTRTTHVEERRTDPPPPRDY